MSISPGCAVLRRTLTSLLRRQADQRRFCHINRLLSRCKYTCGIDNRGILKAPENNIIHTNCVFPGRFSTQSIDVTKVTPVFLRAEEFSYRTAVITRHGRYSYEDLLHYSANLARDISDAIQNQHGSPTAQNRKGPVLYGERIAILCENDLSYVVAKWATWLCGAIAVPLCKAHPTSELEYFVQDSGSCLILCTDAFKDKLKPIADRLSVPLKVIPEDAFSGDFDPATSAWSDVDAGGKRANTIRADLVKALHDNAYKERKAMIIYTSGTTGRPKVRLR